MIPGTDAGVGKLSHFEFLGKFDSTIEKAVKVASRKDVDNKSLYGRDVWLMILKLLHNFRQNAKNHLKNDSSKIERLYDFIQGRLRYVLNEDGMNVSLRQITSELDMSVGDISHLC